MLVRLKLRDGPLDLVGGAGQFPQKKYAQQKLLEKYYAREATGKI